MTISIPDISPALRRWTANVAENNAAFVERVYKALMNIKPYADLDSTTKLDIRDSIVLSSKLWLDSLMSGKMPSEDALEGFRAYGRRRVYQGVPLEALLRAFRLGSRELWCFYIGVAGNDDALRNELLLRISPYLLEFFDNMSQEIAQTFLEEQYRQARWRESLRYQLHGIIFNFPDDTDAFNKTAAALRLDVTIPRVALAIDVESIDSNSATFKTEIDRIVAAAARRLRVPVDDIFDIWFRGQLLMWIPERLGETTGANDSQMARQIASIADTLPEVRAIGVGLPGEGASGWAMSADEASRALSFGRSHLDEARVRLYSEIAVEESIRGTKRTLTYLTSLVEQLAGEPDLLETLRTYFDQLQRRKATASVLGIHPNTLNYRLERIENIVGARLDDAGWISKLDIAIKLRGAAR
ncbi:PucR family transcriptional regulator [Burkholderia cepacia]|uniref:PucR family transcriptional regulator n=1 Tax=Burkholderia TaxID=32008 RepID=UPI00075C773C|nr:helix-turn-helix domain-containing protein [Burkholderia cepacia]KVU60061.1 PucR family transcriptional regulator [Burkholderia cepacia]KVW87806.1 PucR family transcriptional regulator [Burkholderia cepacia]KVX47536.1 PucR family transcriptional regulator [Burkholderia cepacia]KVX73188.1 PucR family transcriptional regulator [Burkholderia cepacia]KWD61119.1 PucR family transcriptional regulator [Burkholderia cepacia]